jgi:spore coat polysaccharide biosynthesis predicted glycosyltransferase SpsG
MAIDFDFVYHCDSWPEIGNGHLKRGTDILNALCQRNPDLNLGIFGSWSPGAKALMEVTLNPAVTIINDVEIPRSRVAILDTMHFPGKPDLFNTKKTALVKESADLFVIISSGLGPNLPVECDMLIDHLPRVAIEGVMPGEVRFGFDYAPVSNEFFNGNERMDEFEGCVVAVLGAGDKQGGPLKLAEILYERITNTFPGFVMLLSPHYPQEKRDVLTKRFPGLHLLQRIPNVAPLLRAANAVICTYGNITFESLSCGKPTFLVNYESFQNMYGWSLEGEQLVVQLGMHDDMDQAKVDLIFDETKRQELATQAKTQFVRPGIEAIVKELLPLV